MIVKEAFYILDQIFSSFSSLSCSHFIHFAVIGIIFSVLQQKITIALTQDFDTILIFELFLRSLILPFLPWYPSQSDFFCGSGCMSKTLTAPQCGPLPKLVVALLNLVDHIFSCKNVLIPWTTDLKNSSFALLLQVSGKRASSVEEEGSIRYFLCSTSCSWGRRTYWCIRVPKNYRSSWFTMSPFGLI